MLMKWVMTNWFTFDLPTLCHFSSGIVQPLFTNFTISCPLYHFVVCTKSHFCHILSISQ
ncbi:hypothetical protein SAMN02745220_03710 [Desulfopila aestuarii DSM 18488]|uniref:Uncharacterized protein n=1 Tax=Desulfopila aestuarii DSM 18488 TaxID=1121416 RepID=A0A1M7YE70_9BACT|nr:hypothetical protein SAMN02745220_03710 [Desulfopila aestuarii DSM 18488]